MKRQSNASSTVPMGPQGAWQDSNPAARKDQYFLDVGDRPDPVRDLSNRLDGAHMTLSPLAAHQPLFPIPFQKRTNLLSDIGTALNFAFPQDEHVPAGFRKVGQVFRFARSVPFQLRNPVIAVGLGKARGLAGGVGVLVPETAVNENHLPTARKHEVGAARQVMPVQTVPVAHSVDQAADSELGLRVLAANCPLYPAANLWRLLMHGEIPK